MKLLTPHQEILVLVLSTSLLEMWEIDLVSGKNIYNPPRVGVQKKLAKILTMEAKTVKTNKRTKSGQKWLKSAKSCHYFEPL